MIREFLEDVSTIDDVVNLLQTRKRIVVITGAGISVSCGIPDFRSKEGGLYNTLDCAAYGIPSAELLFDREFFEIDPQPFYKFAKSLLPNVDAKPSPTHRFVELLSEKKRLLRNYSQNVDGLEKKLAGLPQKQLVECHGSMSHFRCTGCRARPVPLDDALSNEIQLGKVPYCSGVKCGGVLKPDITFFGEALPASLARAVEDDLPKCDLVLVIGTSLKVGGSVMEILRRIAPDVPQILINKETVKLPAFSRGFDVSLLGKCDDVVRYLCFRLGWPGPPGSGLPQDADLSALPSASAKKGRDDGQGKRKRASREKETERETETETVTVTKVTTIKVLKNVGGGRSGTRSDKSCSAAAVSIEVKGKSGSSSSASTPAVVAAQGRRLTHSCEEVSSRVFQIATL